MPVEPNTSQTSQSSTETQKMPCCFSTKTKSSASGHNSRKYKTFPMSKSLTQSRKKIGALPNNTKSKKINLWPKLTTSKNNSSPPHLKSPNLTLNKDKKGSKNLPSWNKTIKIFKKKSNKWEGSFLNWEENTKMRPRKSSNCKSSMKRKDRFWKSSAMIWSHKIRCSRVCWMCYLRRSSWRTSWAWALGRGRNLSCQHFTLKTVIHWLFRARQKMKRGQSRGHKNKIDKTAQIKTTKQWLL